MKIGRQLSVCRFALFGAALCLSVWQGGGRSAGQGAGPGQKTPPPEAAKWQALFDGKSLKGWKEAKFGGEGEVLVEGGAIVMEPGTAIDCCGHEILVRNEEVFDFREHFREQWKKLKGKTAEPDQQPFLSGPSGLGASAMPRLLQ